MVMMVVIADDGALARSLAKLFPIDMKLFHFLANILPSTTMASTSAVCEPRKEDSRPHGIPFRRLRRVLLRPYGCPGQDQNWYRTQLLSSDGFALRLRTHARGR